MDIVVELSLEEKVEGLELLVESVVICKRRAES